MPDATKWMRTPTGHLLALTVGRGSLEVAVTVHEQRLERRRAVSRASILRPELV